MLSKAMRAFSSLFKSSKPKMPKNPFDDAYAASFDETTPENPFDDRYAEHLDEDLAGENSQDTERLVQRTTETRANKHKKYKKGVKVYRTPGVLIPVVPF